MPSGLSRLGDLVGEKKEIPMPNLMGMTFDEAKATLVSEGIHRRFQMWPPTQPCDARQTLNGRLVIIEKDRICHQHPSEGTIILREQANKFCVELQIVQEDPSAGKIGTPSEWRRMPNVVGMPLAEALAAIEKAGLTNKDLTVIKDRRKPWRL